MENIQAVEAYFVNIFGEVCDYSDSKFLVLELPSFKYEGKEGVGYTSYIDGDFKLTENPETKWVALIQLDTESVGCFMKEDGIFKNMNGVASFSVQEMEYIAKAYKIIKGLLTNFVSCDTTKPCVIH